MSTPNPRHQQLGTYTVQGVFGNEELHRLQLQDRLVTTALGRMLPEQIDPTRLSRVLDIACGTGGWLIELARAYPCMTELIGVDIDPKMVSYARRQAQALGVADRVDFRQMNALLGLEFPDSFFDLVHERFAVSWLRTWDWPKFLSDCQRAAKPGALICLTESHGIFESQSAALTRLCQLAINASHQAGHLFTLHTDGVARHLASLLRQHGLQHVQTQEYRLVCPISTPSGQLMAEDLAYIYRVLVPFLRKWIRLPDDYEEIYQQMLRDLQQPDLVVTWPLLTAWGTRSPTFFPPEEVQR